MSLSLSCHPEDQGETVPAQWCDSLCEDESWTLPQYVLPPYTLVGTAQPAQGFRRHSISELHSQQSKASHVLVDLQQNGA